MRRYRYDYYDVAVPADLYGTIRECAEYAIYLAEERSRLYCLPALWRARLLEGSETDLGDFTTNLIFRVVRKRRNLRLLAA